MNPNLQWRPLLPSDLNEVDQIADQIHTGLPERPEVFLEKIRLFPAGCRKLIKDNKCVGYAISHPWNINSIPPLDEFLGNLPTSPECLYLHDIVVLPIARGGGAAEAYVSALIGIAATLQIRSLALTSVYGTDKLWNRLGFSIVHSKSLDQKLVSYGASAKYMIYQMP